MRHHVGVLLCPFATAVPVATYLNLVQYAVILLYVSSLSLFDVVLLSSSPFDCDEILKKTSNNDNEETHNEIAAHCTKLRYVATRVLSSSLLLRGGYTLQAVRNHKQTHRLLARPPSNQRNLRQYKPRQLARQRRFEIGNGGRRPTTLPRQEAHPQIAQPAA